MRGDGQNQLQISAPLPLKEILRMIPLSAQPISLDSPFNTYGDVQKQCILRQFVKQSKNVFFSSQNCFKPSPGLRPVGVRGVNVEGTQNILFENFT
jgi:hypothetical protein